MMVRHLIRHVIIPETARCLLLAPGAQIYYGRLARPLIIQGTQGDATLRSFMNWSDWKTTQKPKDPELLATSWAVRARHMAIGAGIHPARLSALHLFKNTQK